MKKLLFIFCFMPLFAFSQIELGVNGGNVFNAGASIKLFKCLKVGIGYETYTVTDPFATGYNYPVAMKNIYLSADYSKTFKRNEIYGGAAVGIVSFNNTQETPYVYGNTGKGKSYSIHAGYSFDVWKGICVNAQVGYSHDDVSIQKSLTKSGSFNYYPITVGIHYKISFKNTNS